MLTFFSRLYNRSLNLLLDCITCKDLSQWEIAILMYSGILCDNNDYGADTHDKYLKYFEHNLDTERQMMDHIFTRCVIESALQYSPERNLLFCSGGKGGDEESQKPRPGSTTLEWRWNGLLRRLVDNVRKHSTRKEHIEIIAKLCYKHGYVLLWSVNYACLSGIAFLT